MDAYTVVGIFNDSGQYYVNTVLDAASAKEAADRERAEVEGLRVVAVFEGSLQPFTEEGVSDFE